MEVFHQAEIKPPGIRAAESVPAQIAEGKLGRSCVRALVVILLNGLLKPRRERVTDKLRPLSPGADVGGVAGNRNRERKSALSRHDSTHLPAAGDGIEESSPI